MRGSGADAVACVVVVEVDAWQAVAVLGSGCWATHLRQMVRQSEGPHLRSMSPNLHVLWRLARLQLVTTEVLGVANALGQGRV